MSEIYTLRHQTAISGALVVARSYRSIKSGFERILKKVRSKPGLMLRYDFATTSAPAGPSVISTKFTYIFQKSKHAVQISHLVKTHPETDLMLQYVVATTSALLGPQSIHRIWCIFISFDNEMAYTNGILPKLTPNYCIHIYIEYHIGTCRLESKW